MSAGTTGTPVTPPAGGLELSVGAVVDEVERMFSVADRALGRPLAAVKTAYREFLVGRNPRTNEVHHWSVMRPTGQLTLGAAVTGTATSSGTTEATVTATTAIFNPSMVGLSIVVTDGGGVGVDLTIQIIGFTSTSVVTTDNTTAFAGRVITVGSNGIVALPSTFGGFIDEVSPFYSSTARVVPMKPASVESILRDWRTNTVLGPPTMFSVMPAAFVSASGSAKELWIAPRPDTVYPLEYRYFANPADVTDSTECYFLGGWQFSETIKLMAMAQAERDTGGVAGVWSGKAEIALLSSIEADTTRDGENHIEQVGDVYVGLGR